MGSNMSLRFNFPGMEGGGRTRVQGLRSNEQTALRVDFLSVRNYYRLFLFVDRKFSVVWIHTSVLTHSSLSHHCLNFGRGTKVYRYMAHRWRCTVTKLQLSAAVGGYPTSHLPDFIGFLSFSICRSNTAHLVQYGTVRTQSGGFVVCSVSFICRVLQAQTDRESLAQLPHARSHAVMQYCTVRNGK